MSLTVNILVKNNEETIEEVLKSAYSIADEVLIGDIGSADSTIKICKKYKAKIIDVPFRGNFSESKNYMIEKNKSWLMFLEPYESIVSIPNSFNDYLNEKETSYRIKIIKNDLVTKDIRIWHKENPVLFKNPVFESAFSKKCIKNIDLFLTSNKDSIDEEKLKILKEWRDKNPIQNEPLYYLICVSLMQKKWKEFINLAETYLHKPNIQEAPSLMTRYYLSMIKTYINTEKDYEGSIKYILSCIAEKPLMAEFWCMLGDIYYHTDDQKKAKSFYENAIILGARRTNEDDLPIEISKYKKYPLKMIDACKNIEKKIQLYKSSKI